MEAGQPLDIERVCGHRTALFGAGVGAESREERTREIYSVRYGQEPESKFCCSFAATTTLTLCVLFAKKTFVLTVVSTCILSQGT